MKPETIGIASESFAYTAASTHVVGHKEEESGRRKNEGDEKLERDGKVGEKRKISPPPPATPRPRPPLAP